MRCRLSTRRGTSGVSRTRSSMGYSSRFQQTKLVAEKHSEARAEGGKRGYGGHGHKGRDAKRRG